MAYEVEVRSIAPQHVVSIRGTCRPEDVAVALSRSLPATFRYVIARGVQPAGRPFTRFFERSGDAVEFEGGCPVSEPVDGEGEIVANVLPGGEVAATVHVGPYDDLPQAAAALLSWAAANGREAAGPPWEVYLSDPGEVIDPFEWRTEVLLPLR